jgi:hypothetical protein
MQKKCFALAMAAALATQAGGARADALSDLFTQGHVDGQLRLYQFDRHYAGPTPDASALAGVLLLNAQTGTFGGGFSFGATLASATAFGTHDSQAARVDTTLMGAHNVLTVLPQAYVQYQRDAWLVRGGYQYLDTPWMGQSDSRAIPLAYNALLVGWKPAAGWDVYGIRQFTFKSRTSDQFFADNLYYPSNYHDDSMYGNNPSLPRDAREAGGTWAFGTTYAHGGLKAQAWYYSFLQFARMGYAEGSYVFKTGSGFDPVIGMQYLHENTGSNNTLVDTQTKLVGVAGTRVDAQVWGADLGLVIPHGRLDAYYNKLGQEDGAVGGGSIISPYSTGLSSDPLYTTSMFRGLVEQGPGHAWKTKASYNLFADRLQLMASYAEYSTVYRGHNRDLHLEVAYNFTGRLKDLSLRDRWERSSGGTHNLNPDNQPFTYNRLMLSYKF